MIATVRSLEFVSSELRDAAPRTVAFKSGQRRVDCGVEHSSQRLMRFVQFPSANAITEKPDKL